MFEQRVGEDESGYEFRGGGYGSVSSAGVNRGVFGDYRRKGEDVTESRAVREIFGVVGAVSGSALAFVGLDLGRRKTSTGVRRDG